MSGQHLLKIGTVALAMFGTVAAAQDAQPAGEEAQVAASEPFAPSWSDEEIAHVAEMLTGTWQTAEPVAEFGSETDGAVRIVMQIWPVPVAGVDNALYVETARADELGEPYRQAIFALYRYKDNIRLRTYEFRLPAESLGAMVGTWAAPDYFPSTSRESLIATLDVELEETSGGYAGATPYPYPTGEKGAVEMTSRVELYPERMVTADRGFDANGQVVWGAESSSQWTWNKIENPVKVIHFDKGVVAVEYAHPEGDAIQPGDSLHMHYSGWTGDGHMFDSSRPRQRPYVFAWPAPGRLIDGWNIAAEGMTVGTKRRLIIPSEAGYGERGQPRANIPPNATLYFEIELMHFDRPEPQPEESSEQPEGEHSDHDGHDHGDGG